MLDFPGAKLQKLGPSGEKIVANAVPGLDAFGGEGPKIKNVLSTATSTVGNELLAFAQSLQGHGEDLKYPLEKKLISLEFLLVKQKKFMN